MNHMQLPSPQRFLDRLFNLPATQLGQLDHLYLDHLCYRVATATEYEQIKRAMARDAMLLGESQVGGRPIATYRLHIPFTYRHRNINVIEIPAPKPGSPYPTGYEHAEFVTDRPLEAFLNLLTQSLTALPHQLDTRGLAKITNRDIRLQLAPHLSVKFHEQSLAEVILAEQSQMDSGPQ